jgi:SPX domain protein involved in polyphosphate accumulation
VTTRWQAALEQVAMAWPDPTVGMLVCAGELVLLLHWSTLNVTGLSKILKKHDKVSKGHVQLRASYLANALQQVPLAARLHSVVVGISSLQSDAIGCW